MYGGAHVCRVAVAAATESAEGEERVAGRATPPPRPLPATRSPGGDNDGRCQTPRVASSKTQECACASRRPGTEESSRHRIFYSFLISRCFNPL